MALGGAQKTHAAALRALTKAFLLADSGGELVRLGHGFAVRWSWQVGVILDDLMAGMQSEPGSRSGIDGGSWIVSTVSMLEPLPPYQEFAKHTVPGPAESQVSALYDPRWADIFLRSLKDRESYNEAKKKLQTADRSRNQGGNQSSEEKGGGQPPKGKGKGGKSRKVVRSKSPRSDGHLGRGDWQ